MIAAVFRGPGEMEATEVDVPDIGPDEVLMKVGANTLCGTDGRILRGEKTKGVRRPSIPGHEVAGRGARGGGGATPVGGPEGRPRRGGRPRGVRRPSILGHEFAGHVARVGRGVRGFEVGTPGAMGPGIPDRGGCYWRAGRGAG